VATTATSLLDRLRRARRTPDGTEWRASWFELFFDLVFVLVVSQLSALLVANLTLAGAGETLFLLLVAWWAWIYTTWTTNWFDPDSAPIRLALVAGMFASMLGAIAIPDAFGERALLLVAGYVAIQLVRNACAVAAADTRDPLRPALVRILVWTLWVAPLWLAGALLDGEARVVVWVVALAADYLGPAVGHWNPVLGRSRPQEWDLEPGHFSERLMLFLIIALGEVVVAVGRAAAELSLTPARLAAVVVCFGIAAALWWLYFDFHAERTLHGLKAAEGQRARLARDLSYLFVPLTAGIILCAVANEFVIAHPTEELGARELAVLAAGPLVYLLGSIGLKLRIIGGLWERRAVASVLVVAAGAAGAVLPAVACWALMLAILAGLGIAEIPVVRRERERVAALR
jgi:low temperature requirement protein LtrA